MHPELRKLKNSLACNPVDKKARKRAALGAGLRSFGGSVIGSLVGGGPGAVIGSMLGGGTGGYIAAPPRTKIMSAVGGAAGGAVPLLGLPAALGSYLGSNVETPAAGRATNVRALKAGLKRR